MTEVFEHREVIRPDWIDYNAHMQDAYYGLVYSYAVDALQDAVGLDAAYRAATGCTIYLLEGHTVFLQEVKEAETVRVETRVIGLDAKRFHVHCQMWRGSDLASVGEFMELHVNQRPEPHSAPMPEAVQARLAAALWPDAKALPHRARAIGLRR
jgi:Predicted thioesterase